MMAWILITIFVILTITVGGDRTAKSSVTIGINGMILILTVFAVYWGLPSLPVTIIAALLVIYCTVFFQNDRSVKTEAAFISVVLILVLMLLFIFIFVYKGNLAGFPVLGEHKIRPSNGYEADIGMNMNMLQVCVILIALTGSVIDTAVAVTSGVFEVKRNNPYLEKDQLFLSGMRIGREIISSTVNTLFFIFAGEYLVMFVNFSMFYSFQTMINSKDFAQGSISVLISAIGCVLIIPVAALLSGIMFEKLNISSVEEEKAALNENETEEKKPVKVKRKLFGK